MFINKKIFIDLVIMLIVLVGFWVGWKLRSGEGPGGEKPVACTMEAKLCSDGSSIGRVPPKCDFAACPKEDLIVVESPRAYEEISSPFLIKGKARGSWFFEADFLIKLLDENGNLLATAIAQAQGDWMTTDFVPFEAKLTFSAPAAKKGFLVFEKDNPSGLPEHADELRVPIEFNPGQY